MVLSKTAGAGPKAGEAAFLVAARTYGRNLADSTLSDVYRKVTTRMKGALVQLRAMRDEEERGGGAGGDDEDEGSSGSGAGVLGFGKAERLSGFGVGGAGALKGGLVKKHTFQVTCALHRTRHNPSR